MTEKEYQPYYLEAVTIIGDDHFVLDVLPRYADEDHYYEIHITAGKSTLQAIEHTIESYIFIHLVSSTQLEIYQGEFYEESSVDDALYQRFEFKTLEKGLKQEWKPKYKQLSAIFKKLFDQKLVPYEATRRCVVSAYRELYTRQLRTGATFGLSSEEIRKTSLFPQLFLLFGDNNPSWAGLHELIDPAYLTPKTAKDWHTAFIKLEKVFNNLEKAVVSDYNTIRNHMTESYARTFNYMLPNLKYNHQNIDEEKYRALFNDLMYRLKQTDEQSPDIV
ncbi:MAG: hypothetical protein QM791_13795 [Ferruginibacter sp.]